jgi:hypothetical protein
MMKSKKQLIKVTSPEKNTKNANNKDSELKTL